MNKIALKVRQLYRHVVYRYIFASIIEKNVPKIYMKILLSTKICFDRINFFPYLFYFFKSIFFLIRLIIQLLRDRQIKLTQVRNHQVKNQK